MHAKVTHAQSDAVLKTYWRLPRALTVTLFLAEYRKQNLLEDACRFTFISTLSFLIGETQRMKL